MTLNYTVPLDKIPATDWLGADYRYQVNYNWRAGPRDTPDDPPIVNGLPDDLDFKNTIQNLREQNYTGRIDMIKLYNKVKFLKELNAAPKVSTRPTNPKLPPRPTKADSVKEKSMPGLAKGLLRLLMSLRSINGTYTLSEGTILPGFTPSPKLFGMDDAWDAPGWAFILGNQDPNIRRKAADKGWLTTNTSLTMPFTQQRNQTINLRANIEPSPDLKVQVDFRKETTNSYQSIFRYDSDVGDYRDLSPSRSGSYRISFNTIRTAFNSSNGDAVSAVFQKFEQNLLTIQQRFSLRGGSSGEYDTTMQDVVIPAFLAAYSGKDAKAVSLSPFPKVPMPNWRVDYTGLNKLGIFKNAFQSITISHAYQSTYSVLNYSNSLDSLANTGDNLANLAINRPIEDYNRSYFGEPNADGKYVPLYVISQVLLSEQFAPLIGVNVRTKSRVTANFQYKTKRDVSLTISNAQITEMLSKDISLEIGFTKNNMRLPFKSEGRLIVLKNDVTFRLNTTVSDTRTIQRKVNELNMITNGAVNIQLRPNISYVVNQKLNIQAYFERTINDPKVSNSYRRATTRFGVQVRFSLAQ